MMQLHYHPGNASLTPHLVAEELGLPLELKLVDRQNNAHKSPDYLKLNPNGQIPVLVDGDLVLYETAAIVLHMVDRAKGLAPAVGSAERSEFYKWLVWIPATVVPQVQMYFYPERFVAPGNTEAAAQVKAVAETKLEGLINQIDAQLAKSGDAWVMGATFTALDCYAFMLGRWTRAMQRPARTLPHYGPFLQRMLARPAVQRVIAREGLSLPWV
jgi:glutathione S-transferase